MSEQDSKRPTLSVKKRTVATPSARDDKPRLRAGARGRQVAQLKLAKDKVKRSTEPTPEVAASKAEQFASTYVAAPPKTRSPRSSGPKALPHVREKRNATEKIFVPEQSLFVPEKTVLLPQGTEVEMFYVFAPCPVGLEAALAAELSALGYDGVSATRAGCHFVADWWGIQRANLYSRLATRILVRVGQAPVQQEDDILELARSIAWERWFGAEHTLRVDTSAVKSPMQSLQYCNLRAKDGICDRLRELEGERPSIDTVRPDARVHLFLSHDTATLYLDTSGESLFKRGWRLDKGDAPLRENLAAGILALSGWDPEAALLDPFCGSGTILIEAAWIALGVPPGITRPFGFERLRDHEANQWEDVKEEARSRILPELETPLVGIDADPLAIEAAQRNAERAYLTQDTIRFELGDARDATAPAATGWMVTNPPYGERLDEEDLEFWREWSANLKREFAGWQVNIITSDLDLPKHLRLKANRRTPVFNGALDCRLFNFELVAASYRD